MAVRKAVIPSAPSFRAKLRLLPSDEGGRQLPVASGYRPAFSPAGQTPNARQYRDAAIELLGVQAVAPGEQASVLIRPTRPEAWEDIKVGSELEIYEGLRLIGTARVLAVEGESSGSSPGEGSIGFVEAADARRVEIPGLGQCLVRAITLKDLGDAETASEGESGDIAAAAFANLLLSRALQMPSLAVQEIAIQTDETVTAISAAAFDDDGLGKYVNQQPRELSPRERLYRGFMSYREEMVAPVRELAEQQLIPLRRALSSIDLSAMNAIAKSLADLHQSSTLAATAQMMKGLAPQATALASLAKSFDLGAVQSAMTAIMQDATFITALKRQQELLISVSAAQRAVGRQLTLPRATALLRVRDPFVGLGSISAVEAASSIVQTRDASPSKVVNRYRIVHDFLDGVSPRLAERIEGARLRIEEGGPDAISQAAHSLQETLDWLLRILAPDDQVIPWSKAEYRIGLDKGRPTRDARVRYICKQQDVDAAIAEDMAHSLVAMTSFFQQAKHGEERINPGQFSFVFDMLVAWIGYVNIGNIVQK